MRIEAVRADITREHVDVVVNAAGPSLLGGGGVDAAIHAAAGPALLEQCLELRRTTWPDGLPVGRAVSTGAGALPARWVVHTVGPDRRRGQRDPSDLARCFTCALDEVRRLGGRSVAFPAVGAGAYGWDADRAADVAVTAATGWVDAHPWALDHLVFVLSSDRLHAAFAAALRRALSG